MLIKKGFYTTLVFTLAVIFTGCTSNRVQLSAEPAGIDPTITRAEPTLTPGTVPTDQPATPAVTSSPDPEPTNSQQIIPGEGKELVESVCIVCHSFDRVSNAHKSKAEWEITVKRMVDHGAPLDEAQQLSAIEYLSATYR